MLVDENVFHQSMMFWQVGDNPFFICRKVSSLLDHLNKISVKGDFCRNYFCLFIKNLMVAPAKIKINRTS